VAIVRAVVVGIGGQDGSYLAEQLVAEGADVVGVTRPGSGEPASLAAVRERVTLVPCDVTNQDEVERLLAEHAPDELYHLAGRSFVPASWDDPVETTRFGVLGTVGLLEATRGAATPPRVVMASSAEVFGDPEDEPQNERTALAPITPYGAAKAYALLVGRAYRRRYGLAVSSAILYNHESPRRPATFVTRKITRGAAAISLGLERELVLGSLDTSRDWGWAPDYVRALRAMAAAAEPDDYVVATGEAHTVAELVERAFARVGLDWRDYVRTDAALVRGAADARRLVGDASRIRERLGWRAEVGFAELVDRMVDADLAELSSR
jgi:GDPmannose 4,6-dehydratase